MSATKKRATTAHKSPLVRTFTMRHDVHVKGSIRAQVAAVKASLKAHKAKQRCVLHPDKAQWLGAWDLLTSVALIWTATITPLETAFMDTVLGPACWSDPWFISNRCLDVIFTADLLLQFFVAYQVGGEDGGRVWVDQQRLIARHYLTTWFPLDAFTVIVPFTFDMLLASGDATGPGGGGAAGSSFASNMSLLRVLRVLRLVKLVRLLRASRLVDRWRSKITLSHGTQVLIACALQLLLACVARARSPGLGGIARPHAGSIARPAAPWVGLIARPDAGSCRSPRSVRGSRCACAAVRTGQRASSRFKPRCTPTLRRRGWASTCSAPTNTTGAPSPRPTRPPSTKPARRRPTRVRG